VVVATSRTWPGEAREDRPRTVVRWPRPHQRAWASVPSATSRAADAGAQGRARGVVCRGHQGSGPAPSTS
jgi:hypothetical protein